MGPILFTIYTSPTGAIAKRHNLEIHLYADDTQIYIFFKTKDIKSEAEALRTIQECVSEMDGGKQTAIERSKNRFFNYMRPMEA